MVEKVWAMLTLNATYYTFLTTFYQLPVSFIKKELYDSVTSFKSPKD
jgi:hypothetical protein